MGFLALRALAPFAPFLAASTSGLGVEAMRTPCLDHAEKYYLWLWSLLLFVSKHGSYGFLAFRALAPFAPFWTRSTSELGVEAMRTHAESLFLLLLFVV